MTALSVAKPLSNHIWRDVLDPLMFLFSRMRMESFRATRSIRVVDASTGIRENPTESKLPFSNRWKAERVLAYRRVTDLEPCRPSMLARDVNNIQAHALK
ncbi:hypothetical protein RF11_07231 [Thelohanellus kitauei]|uniref:Uncharacterized protein n=1 Tax=Thelohanellus kitauei TaxID=669202 RepID=A0A0C2J7U3_THEKT|nr:hypothetical protein RF11_07231 [Thelohanellus kitauei]